MIGYKTRATLLREWQQKKKARKKQFRPAPAVRPLCLIACAMEEGRRRRNKRRPLFACSVPSPDLPPIEGPKDVQRLLHRNWSEAIERQKVVEVGLEKERRARSISSFFLSFSLSFFSRSLQRERESSRRGKKSRRRLAPVVRLQRRRLFRAPRQR